jgi:hypothetical protein
MIGKEEDRLERIRRIKRANEKALLAKANVVGIGIGFRQRSGKRTDEIAVLVMVEKKVPALELSPQDLIPSEIDGVPVDVLEIGRLTQQKT